MVLNNKVTGLLEFLMYFDAGAKKYSGRSIFIPFATTLREFTAMFAIF